MITKQGAVGQECLTPMWQESKGSISHMGFGSQEHHGRGQESKGRIALVRLV